MQIEPSPNVADNGLIFEERLPPEIWSLIADYCEPDNLFINMHKHRFGLSTKKSEEIRQAYIDKKRNYLWLFFARVLKPIHIDLPTAKLPVANALSIDSSFMAVAYTDGTIIFYDTITGDIAHTCNYNIEPTAIDLYKKDLMTIGFVDGTIAFFHYTQNQSNVIHPASNKLIALAHTANRVIASFEDGLCAIINPDDMSYTTFETNISNITTMYAQNELLILGDKEGIVYFFDLAELKLIHCHTVGTKPIIEIKNGNGSAQYDIETTDRTYSYDSTNKESLSIDSESCASAMPHALSSHAFALFEPYGTFYERFKQGNAVLSDNFTIGKAYAWVTKRKPLLSQNFNMGSIYFFTHSDSICAISDEKHITIFNATQLISQLSLKALLLIGTLEREYQSKSFLGWMFKFLSQSCSRKKSKRTAIQDPVWANIYQTLPSPTKELVRKAYHL